MEQENFTPLSPDYVIAALRSGCGIRWDWVDSTDDNLKKFAAAAAAGRARLEFVVPGGAAIPVELLQALGKAGEGYVSMDFSQGY